jgi:GNAT superfamily N-acetyltransferase
MLSANGVTSYLAELLLAPAHRHRGIGRQLISEAFGPDAHWGIDLITYTTESFYTSLPIGAVPTSASTLVCHVGPPRRGRVRSETSSPTRRDTRSPPSCGRPHPRVP